MPDGCNLYCTESGLTQIEEFLENKPQEADTYELIEKQLVADYHIDPIGKYKTELGRDVGIFEHKDWENEMREKELAKGRIEVKNGMEPIQGDFACEFQIYHPGGNKYIFDYVDFKNHIILDRKPQDSKTSDDKLVEEWCEKMNKYAEAYAARFGHIPKVHLSPYPSTKDLFRETDSVNNNE
ncbi:MAG: hypothetical protein HF978_06770 [Desulfobacteraceae bacterium]|nr:hypothetical protein [Desulfobacteraceae bacterium]MBC2755235.1 hypothetical protein [Desulfobacteraceae bacterium]